MQLTIGLAFLNTSCYVMIFDLHSMFEDKCVVSLTLVYLKKMSGFAVYISIFENTCVVSLFTLVYLKTNVWFPCPWLCLSMALW